ncbi:SRPBCC family protein [Sciscionella sediminilitoris]|uniref:SRPBCC family protein n=1 Tax=Sciscionella sediminilitoris TaxID=1445613 RepID=UPI000689B36F|nr:SRPBCC family protein [Sciscionella sp. SE31]
MADLFSFEFTAHTKASQQAAFDAVANAEDWTKWGKPVVRATKLTRTGSPDERGVGAVRAMGAFPGGPLPIKERITAFEPHRRIGYTLATPAPMRNYAGELTFTESDGGTDVRWQIQFEELIPASGPLIRAAFRQLIGTFHGKLIRYLDEQAR